MITDHLEQLVRASLAATSVDAELVIDDALTIDFERPKRREHGDWSTNVALVAAKRRGNPRAIAKVLAEHIPASDLVKDVEVAGPGFLNFRLADKWFHDVVRRAADERSGFGQSVAKTRMKINVEYVSANPTGPMNVVSGRHAAVGDAMSNLLEATGHEVTREFLWNDTGRQIRLFAQSVAARYLQHFGDDAELPEDGYRGDYVIEIAREVADEIGDKLVDVPDEERLNSIREIGMTKMLETARAALDAFGTRFDVWMAETALHDSGAVEEGVERLRRSGWIDERDGALWFKSSELGDDKDRVVVRSDGVPTYLAADVAYLIDKFGRGFDELIYVWGADHHGTVPRLLAAVEALGFDRSCVQIPLIQMVTLSRGGEAIKASKRAGNIVPLVELLEEVGPDAARYIFLTRSLEAPIDFDIELAKEQAPENPVYYVQYAHARICSIVRKAAQEGVLAVAGDAPLERLGHPSEDELMRKLASFEDVVAEAAHQLAPQKIARYVEELASDFSAFYRDCKVLSEDRELTQARLALCAATKNVIASGLALLGVGAPERM